jgi:Ase1/PRC1/MAP65 family protein
LIPAWEAETGRPFQVNGESMLQILLEATCANSDGKEVQRSGRSSHQIRAGSVPPTQALVPENGTRVVSARRGVVRPASADSHSERPSKKQRLDESTSTSRAGGSQSIKKNITKASIAMPVPLRAVTPGSSLPRPIMTRSATQRAALGHGRTPSTQQSAGIRQTSAPYTQNHITLTSSTHRSFSCSTSVRNSEVAARKAVRARRKSFRPRPSTDTAWTLTVSSRYTGPVDEAVHEDNEDD